MRLWEKTPSNSEKFKKFSLTSSRLPKWPKKGKHILEIWVRILLFYFLWWWGHWGFGWYLKTLFPLNKYQNSLSPLDLKVFLRSCYYSMHIRTWILEHMLLLDQIEEEKTSRLKLHNWSQNLSEVVFEQVWTNLNISNFHKSMNNFKQVFKSLCKFECCFNFTRWTKFWENIGDFMAIS